MNLADRGRGNRTLVEAEECPLDGQVELGTDDGLDLLAGHR